MSNNPLSLDLRNFGATYTPASAPSGAHAWRVVSATGPHFGSGQHTIFVDVLGLEGRRVGGIPVVLYNGGEARKPTEVNKDPGYALDFPIFAGGNAYGVRVDDGQWSDAVFGMGLVPFKDHASYKVIFRLSVASGDEGPTPPPPTGKTARQLVDDAIGLLEQARALLVVALLLTACAYHPANHTLEAHDLFEYVSDSHLHWRPL